MAVLLGAIDNENILYHGSETPLNLNYNTIPVFFTKDINYAKVYGTKVYKYKVVLNKPFDTSKDLKALNIYNQEFLPYAKEKFKSESNRFVKLKKGQHLPFITADYLWLFLRIYKRNGKDFGYDGLVVDEEVFSISKKSKLSYVPLDISQVKLVK